MRIAELHKLISDACPIHGINSDGVISFKDDATDAQKVAAQKIMADELPGLDLSATPIKVDVSAIIADADALNELKRALESAP